MTLMRVTAVDYVTVEDPEPEPVVKVCGRDEYGERRVHYVYGTRPYLYVHEDTPVGDFEERVVGVEYGYEATDPDPQNDGLPLKKWVCRIPDDVSDIKDELGDETWEADIPYYRRCSIDYDLSGYIEVRDEKDQHISDTDTDPDVSADDRIEPRLVYGDIEVLVGDDSFEEMRENADQPVVAVTFYDTHRSQYDIYIIDDGELSAGDLGEKLRENGIDPAERDVDLHRCPTEEDLLDSVLGYFEDVRPDITTGWNWVDFDILYLLRRIKGVEAEDYDINLDRLSDAGGTKRNFSDYHGDLARAIRGVPAIDMMKLFFERIEFSKWRAKSLEYVSQKLLGRGKLDDVKVTEGFENDKAALAAYNAVDVDLCVEIDETRDIIETCMGLAEESQVQIYDVFSEMRLVDGYIMSRSADDEVLPNQEDSDVPENEGGLTLSPSSGIKLWVGVMDLKSLYPSCMITWNISPETVAWQDDDPDPDLKVPWVTPSKQIDYPIDEDDISWDRLGTSLEEEGLVPKYLKLLFENREEAKAKRDEHKDGSTAYETWDRKQYGLKVLMNSFYGVSSNDYWRLAKDGLGDAVTSAARYALYAGKTAIEETGYEVIYGDTDSCFFSLEREDPPATDEEYRDRAVLDGKGLTNSVNFRMEKCIRESGLEGDHPYLDGSLPHGKGTHCIHYEFEKLYRRYVQFGNKKRYAGLIVWKEGKVVDKIDVTGFESQRSDTPELAAEAQEEVLHMVLDGEGFDGVSDYVSGLVDDIKAGSIDYARIARPKSISQPKNEYSNPNNQVLRACRASAEQFGTEWRKGDDPFLVYLKSTPPGVPAHEVMALEWGMDLEQGYDIDGEEHVRICLELPLDPIIDELGWEWFEVKNGTRAGDAMEGDWGAPAEVSNTGLPRDSSDSQDGDGELSDGKSDTPDDGESSSDSSNALDADW